MSSSSTMFRKAKEALKKGHRSAAKRFREEGNKLRRKEREAAAYAASKKAEVRKSKKKAIPEPEIIASLQQAMNYADTVNAAERQQTIQDHPLNQATARIMGHISRDSPLMEETIRRELIDAQALGASEVHDNTRMLLKIQSDAAAVNVVSGFMAICELAQKANDGALPPTLSLSGYTAAKVYDALKEVGYTANGRQGVDRGIIGRASTFADRNLGNSL